MLRLFLIATVFSLPLGISAQGEKKPLQVRFAAQRLPANLGNVVMVAEETKSEAFALPINFLSPRQTAPTRQFVLQPEGKDVPLAKITLPTPSSDFIVLLVLQDGKGFTPVVLPSKAASFKPGDTYLHNTSKKIILGQVGTSKFVLKPSEGKVVRPAGAREGRFYDVAIGVREGDRNRVISTTRWPVEERVRSYLFFWDDPKRKDVDFRAIDEFVPVEKKD